MRPTARTNDRRVYQRLNLPEPIAATLGLSQVEILEIGLGGVLIAHGDSIHVGARGTLTFAASQKNIELDSELVRRSQAPFMGHANDPLTTHSGLRIEKVRPSLDVFRAFLFDQIKNALLLQTPHALQIHLTVAPLPDPSALMAHRLIMGTWESARTTGVGQPPDGFTILEGSTENVSALRRVYESVDGEGQRLVRMLGELDIGGVNPSATPA